MCANEHREHFRKTIEPRLPRRPGFHMAGLAPKYLAWKLLFFIVKEFLTAGRREFARSGGRFAMKMRSIFLLVLWFGMSGFTSAGQPTFSFELHEAEAAIKPQADDRGFQAGRTGPEQPNSKTKAAALEALQRQRERLPLFYDDLLALMDVRSGQSVAEIGAGAGEFSVRLARTVGRDGRVFANEIERNLVEDLESLENREQIPQLSAVLGGEDDPRLPDRVDRVFLNMVYHHLSRPDDFMTRLLDYVKPGGLMAVSAVDIHIRKVASNGSPDPCISDPEETRAAIEDTGWVFQAMKHSVSNLEKYVLVFAAPATPPERMN